MTQPAIGREADARRSHLRRWYQKRRMTRPAVCCHRSRTAVSHRRSSRATAMANESPSGEAAILSLDRLCSLARPSDPRRKLAFELIRTLRVADALPGDVPQLAEAPGCWQLPPLARREGGLYTLPAMVIQHLYQEAASTGRRERLGAPYARSHLEPLYSSLPEPKPSPTRVEKLCAGRLPTIDFRRTPPVPDSPLGALPSDAARLLDAGMACVMHASAIFAPGVEKWCRAEYLAAQLKLLCHVLIAPSAVKKFKYWTDLKASPAPVLAV